jgi:hypothetical protein
MRAARISHNVGGFILSGEFLEEASTGFPGSSPDVRSSDFDRLIEDPADHDLPLVLK